MKRGDLELGLLNAVRFIGWLLFGFAIVNTITIKVASEKELYVLFVAFAVLIFGAFFKFLFLEKVFSTVTADDAGKYFRPYRMGAFLFLALASLVAVLFLTGR